MSDKLTPKCYDCEIFRVSRGETGPGPACQAKLPVWVHETLFGVFITGRRKVDKDKDAHRCELYRHFPVLEED